MSCSKTTIIIEFNQKIYELLEQIKEFSNFFHITIFTVKDMLMYKSACELNNDIIIKLFIKYALCYNDKIINYDYSCIEKIDISKIDIGIPDINLISKYLDFIKIWKQLNDKNRVIFFNNLQLLCKIATVYLSL